MIWFAVRYMFCCILSCCKVVGHRVFFERRESSTHCCNVVSMMVLILWCLGPIMLYNVFQWPIGTNDCAGRLDCESLGWSATTDGVCGSSILHHDACMREASFEEALETCAELGARLCTVSELQSGKGNPDECG
eukprot:SAG22_NODE_215_length_14950_cov_4.960676_4_plen_134_part_00